MEKIKTYVTNFLKTVGEGLYSIAEGMSTFNPFYPSIDVNKVIKDLDRGPEKDRDSIASDWKAVGNGLENAIKQFGSKYKPQQS